MKNLKLTVSAMMVIMSISGMSASFRFFKKKNNDNNNSSSTCKGNRSESSFTILR